MLASCALEQPVRLQPPQAFPAEALQKASGRLAYTGSFSGSRSERRARCSPQGEESSSDGRKLPQNSLVLQQLLHLGRTPSEDEVSEILSAELNNWRENPWHVTVILNSLARLRLPLIAKHVLALMLARSVPANVLHYNAAISAYGKGGQWQLALSLLSSMPDISIVPSQVSYNAAISACDKGGQWQLALNLLSRMPDGRVVPNEITYSAAINACHEH
ncbi:unnamed protein product [Polarella glacialis]|uniref:Pentatricopeptide repeat-containing protein n=1 Tax=Polarella glacialis TaxID=89957 RepID=A0A813H6T9_POLGL|nr:unnamed protein product [Polarella glacialis]